MPVTSTIIQTKDNVYGNNNSVEYNPMAISGLSKLVICETENSDNIKKLYISGITYDDLNDFIRTGFDLVFTNDTYISTLTKFRINDDVRWQVIPVETELYNQSIVSQCLLKNKIYKCRYLGTEFKIYNSSDVEILNFKRIDSHNLPYTINLSSEHGCFDFYIFSNIASKKLFTHINIIREINNNLYFKMDGVGNDGNLYIDKFIYSDSGKLMLYMNGDFSGQYKFVYGLIKFIGEGEIRNYWEITEFMTDNLPSSYWYITVPKTSVFSITNKSATEITATRVSSN